MTWLLTLSIGDSTLRTVNSEIQFEYFVIYSIKQLLL